MNKEELKELIQDLEIGKIYKNLSIEGLNLVESDSVLQELARRKELQFWIEFSSGTMFYTVIAPRKKFLDKRGQWSSAMSKKAKKYLEEITE